MYALQRVRGRTGMTSANGYALCIECVNVKTLEIKFIGITDRYLDGLEFLIKPHSVVDAVRHTSCAPARPQAMESSVNWWKNGLSAVSRHTGPALRINVPSPARVGGLGRYLLGDFFGRPPFLPFSRAAAFCASLATAPPFAPISASHFFTALFIALPSHSFQRFPYHPFSLFDFFTQPR